MFLQKPISNYVKDKEKTASDIIVEIRDALRRSGRKDFVVLFTDDQKFVLLDTSKDVTPGVIIKDGEVVDFKNTDDFQTVTVDAYARYNVLNSISDSKDLERVKEIFAKNKTWVIHINADSDSFEAHTLGMINYAHPDFKISKNIGEEEVSYLLNILCRSVQRGNAFKSGQGIMNFYENYMVVLKTSEDGFLEVDLVER